MSPAGAVALGALLFALLLLIVGLLVWQEARRRPGSEGPAYVVEEAVGFIAARLPADSRRRLGTAGVKRIIEWEIFQLQGLAQDRRRDPVETVAGGSGATIDYILDRIAQVHGATYDRDDVAEVLRLETEYLRSIGAVGDPVETDGEPEGGDEA